MSRLIDRILEKCQPFRFSLMDLSGNVGKLFPSDEWNASKMLAMEGDPVYTGHFDYSELIGAPVIAADDVALYSVSFTKGTCLDDVVVSMAPPFNKFFIEFQRVPNSTDLALNAWGVFITATEDPGKMGKYSGEHVKPRWELSLYAFLERKKGTPFGPVSIHLAGLAEDGTWRRLPDGGNWFYGDLVGLSRDVPEEVRENYREYLAQLLFPAFVTMAFLHCKNVKIRNIAPSQKLSQKHHKKRGRELVRYHVLDINPMKKLLEQYRTGSHQGFRRALHMCRGHFKAFTADAPLLGRHTGTYWWAPHVRGSKSVGAVLKDYRVNAPSDFGRAYREADENPPDAHREAPPSKDPDSVGRGLAAHNRTQNKIAAIIRKLGFVPRSPKSEEPEFDLAWRVRDTLYVCEVKSISPNNEERQLRIAIGQVIRYRQKLNASGHEPVKAVIAVEKAPDDRSWDELCINEDILFVWPEVAETRLRKAFANTDGKDPENKYMHASNIQN